MERRSNETALVEAIVESRIAGAGLDVYSVEPLARSGHPMSPLVGRDNVILFPHLTVDSGIELI